MDRLTYLFKKQKSLQLKLKNKINTQAFRTIMVLAAIDELTEALRETPWKPWKKQQKYNQEKFKEELIDVWHFLINLSLAAELSSNELFLRFKKKHKLNNLRQKQKY